jgi:hypothetical protein
MPKGTFPISVKAKLVEQITVTLPREKRDDVVEYLRSNGWYIARASHPGSDGRLDERTVILTAVRDDTLHSTKELLDEVEYDLKKL